MLKRNIIAGLVQGIISLLVWAGMGIVPQGMKQRYRRRTTQYSSSGACSCIVTAISQSHTALQS